MELVTVFFDDNKRIEVEKGTTYLEIRILYLKIPF